MGVYGDLNIIYPKPYSVYLRGTIGSIGFMAVVGFGFPAIPTATSVRYNF